MTPASAQSIFGDVNESPPAAAGSSRAADGRAGHCGGKASAAGIRTRRRVGHGLAVLAAGVVAAVASPAHGSDADGPRITGFVDGSYAYTVDAPRRWSRAVTRLQASVEGKLGEDVKYKLGGRLDVDPVYYASDFYLDPVKRDQRFSAFWRENYLDFSAGDLALRLGAQHIIWGEVAGLFFADVVSARDLREFLLPSFDIIRIPQWAARAEYFAGDAHLELVWIPRPSFDDIGKPGADFFPAPLSDRPTAGEAALFLEPLKPSRSLRNGNYGVRAGTLIDGWDVAAFYYRSTSAAPTFYRVPSATGPAPFALQPRYDRIWQAGATLTKDFGGFVLRSEAVYAGGQNFASADPAAPEGVVARNTLDWIVSAERPFEGIDGRINVQVFQRVYFGGGADAVALDSGDWGASLLVSAKVGGRLEPSLQWIQTFGGGGALIRPKLTWTPRGDFALAVGLDVFNGSRDGLFGRFANKDRAYLEARYSF